LLVLSENYSSGASGRGSSSDPTAQPNAGEDGSPNGTTNTGAGGYCAGGGVNGGSGGSGVVILSIPEANTATFSGGVTQTSTTSGGRRIYTITAAGASDTVTFS
jgi:hypothetical protein